MKKILALAAAFCLVAFSASLAFSAEPNGQAADPGYIYFDLRYGNVTITASTYTGYLYGVEVTGSHDANNKYYVFQSEEGDSYTVDEDRLPSFIPTAASVTVDGKSWASYITNNDDVEAVIDTWNNEATAAGRAVTNNIVSVSGNSSFNVTIDDIWACDTGHLFSAKRDSGGVGFSPSGSGSMTLTLVGDNRVNAVHYHADKGSGAELIFQGSGSITAASASTDTKENASDANLKGENYWCSAIGGDDSGSDQADGIQIDGGVIFAGTTFHDNCTAIGGGGNAFGGVTINGGTVTAVASTTGTAIGGGIGYHSGGGDAAVNITGGTVYAYNHGTRQKGDDGNHHAVPSAAIGGGSSVEANGNGSTKVTITGGTVYAQSIHGVAIGGGGSALKNGGDATVTITGGTVTAISKAGNIGGAEVVAGASIGGGTGKLSGGTATLVVGDEATHTGPVVRTGSIGGGKALDEGAPVGYAVVKMHGGTLHGQVVMAAGGEKPCSFLMTGGTIDNGNNADAYWVGPGSSTKTFAFLEGNGGAVSVMNGTATMTGGTIQNCRNESRQPGNGDGGGAIFVSGGDFIMTGGTITKCDGYNGGAVLVKGGQVSIDGSAAAEGSKPVISYNTAADGGGIMAWGSTSNIDAKGVIVEQNVSNGSGGGIYAHSGGSIALGEGAIVRNNTARSNGGGAMAIGPVTIDGATITDNRAVNGAGACVSGGGYITMESGTIDKNVASGSGGGVYVSGGDFTMADGAVNDNVAAENGGGAYVSGGNFSMADGAVSNNKATSNGGGIYVSGGNVSVLDGELLKNTAVSGGAVYVVGGSCTMEGGIASGNTATENGGAVYVSKSEATNGSFRLAGGTLKENKAAKSGGGVYVSGGNFTMSAGEVNDNTAVENGGGAYVTGGGFTMTGGKIAENFAEASGGAACVSGGNLQMLGGVMEKNMATNGGAVYVAGGNFDMISGSLLSNGALKSDTKVTEYGGAVYVDGGNITIGVEGCEGGTTKESEHTVGEHTDKAHPIVEGNEAQFGGAFAVRGTNEANGTAITGIVNVYCSWIVGNEADNEGTGHNIYMDGGGLVHYLNSANIGESANHEIVTIGGQLQVVKDGQVIEIRLVYDSNASSFEAEWTGKAPEGYHINLPYCPQEWQDEQAKDENGSKAFVGWTPVPTSSSLAAEVRDSSAYLPVGRAIEVVGDTDGEMTFYAVWAPMYSEISYAYTIDGENVVQVANTSDIGIESVEVDGVVDDFSEYTYENVSYDRGIPNPSRSGFVFKGWLLYADTTKVSNWDWDPVPKGTSSEDVTRVSQVSPELWTGVIDRNFGDITLVAVFEPAYGNLTISKQVQGSIDEGQTFLFLIEGNPDREGVPNFTMEVALNGSQAVVIDQLPVGSYTVSEKEWSWRHTPKSVTAEKDAAATTTESSASFKLTVKGESLTFSDERLGNLWLSGADIARNIFAGIAASGE